MQHHNSVFHQMQRHIPWATFDRLVEDYKADHRVRRLPSKSQFLALLFGQLAGAVSLREIEAAMSSHRSRLYHVGAKLPARSTLADANAKRPWQLFADLFTHMAQAASKRTRRQMGDAVRIIVRLPARALLRRSPPATCATGCRPRSWRCPLR